MFKVSTNKPDHICSAYRCKKGKRTSDRFCAMHTKRAQKERNPIRYTYNFLKSNAKRRNKDFSLTLKQFQLFCDEHNYMELKGKKGYSLSIDRIDPNEGYHYWNLQPLTLRENSYKRHADQKNGKDPEVPF